MSNHHNHQVSISASTLPLLSQVLTIRERRRFESIPTQLGNLFLTQTEAHLHQGSLRSPLVQFRYSRGSDQRHTLRDSTNLPGRSGLKPTLGLTPLALHTSLLPLVCALPLIGARPELKYSASRSYHRIWLAKC